MASNGARSRELTVAVRRVVLGAAPGARIALVEPAHDPPDYSVFRMTGFRLIDCEVITGDRDVELAIVTSGASLHEYDAAYTIVGADLVRIR
jgi:hypothetical protein